jgi:hypothetical protein
MPAGRFPPPWFITELEACFVVIDAPDKMAYVIRVVSQFELTNHC